MRSRSAVVCLIAGALASVGGLQPSAAFAAPKSPLAKVLKQFKAGAGPGEAVAPARTWPEPTSTPRRPGSGLAQHPMLFAGEGHNMIYLVNGGKVVWTYSAGKGGEIDDVWMLTNGHVLFTQQFRVVEITPKKEVVWHYDAPEGTEIHTCQPIGLDKVMIVRNGLPPKVMIFNKKTDAVEVEHAVPAPSLTDPKTVHGQFRRGRMTAAGTYLLSYLTMNKVVEFDKNFSEIWSYSIPSPWAALRLNNGNTLIVDEREKLVREVTPKGETAWEIKQADLPEDVKLNNIQTVDRLANGNTVFFSYTGGNRPQNYPNIIQAVEVTPDKKVVWVLQDWKNLGPATTAQFLDEPGAPEKPGAVKH
jgi:hypothetical protein